MAEVKILTPVPDASNGKSISFKLYLNTQEGSVSKTTILPASYKNVELIQQGCDGAYDVFFVYNEHRGDGVVLLGYYNDGVIK